MASFRSQCKDSDSDSEPPLVILDEDKVLGIKPCPEEEDFIQVDDDDEDEEEEPPSIKSINNVIKKKPVLNSDGLPYENTLSITPQDSQRDSPTPPLISIPEVKAKLELNGGKNGVYDSRVEDTERSPSPDPAGTEMSGMGLSTEELRSLKLRNNNMRQLIYKEVKRPGRQHRDLWEMLGKLNGPPSIRRQFIQEVRQEAVRFKRKELAEELQKRSDSLSKLEVDR